jgi:hypothetical protein
VFVWARVLISQYDPCHDMIPPRITAQQLQSEFVMHSIRRVNALTATEAMARPDFERCVTSQP